MFEFFSIGDNTFAVSHNRETIIFDKKSSHDLYRFSWDDVSICRNRLLNRRNGRLYSINKKGEIFFIKTLPLGMFGNDVYCFKKLYDDVWLIAILLRKNRLLLYDLDGNLLSDVKHKSVYDFFFDENPFLLSDRIFSPYTKKWLPFPDEYVFVYRTKNIERTRKRPFREYFLLVNTKGEKGKKDYILCDENMNIVRKSSNSEYEIGTLLSVNGMYYDILLDEHIKKPLIDEDFFVSEHFQRYGIIEYCTNKWDSLFYDKNGYEICQRQYSIDNGFLGFYFVKGYDYLYSIRDGILNLKTKKIIENSALDGIYDENGDLVLDVSSLLNKRTHKNNFIVKEVDSGFHCYQYDERVSIFDSFGNEIISKTIK